MKIILGIFPCYTKVLQGNAPIIIDCPNEKVNQGPPTRAIGVFSEPKTIKKIIGSFDIRLALRSLLLNAIKVDRSCVSKTTEGKGGWKSSRECHHMP